MREAPPTPNWRPVVLPTTYMPPPPLMDGGKLTKYGRMMKKAIDLEAEGERLKLVMAEYRRVWEERFPYGHVH